MQIKINVTDRHIDESTGCSSTHCAIAHAILEAIGSNPANNFSLVAVGGQSAAVGHAAEIPLPKEAKHFVLAFDLYKREEGFAPRPKPVSFTIDVPALALPDAYFVMHPSERPATEKVLARRAA